MIKQNIHERIISMRSGMYYSPGILFEESLIKMGELETLTKINQLENTWERSGSGAAPLDTC